MKEIRLGTLGSGPIVHAILDNVARTNGVRLAAVYSRGEDTGRGLASKYGAEKVYTDMDAFLSDSTVNFVYIATPNLLHYEQTKRALLAGKNVICEKPFCTKAAQTRELITLAKERHLFLIDATPTAFLPNLEILKRELPKIGKVKLVQGNYSQYSSRYDKLRSGEVPNIFNPAYAGGSLMDINYYNVYLTAALFGKPAEAVYYPNLYNGAIDTSGVMILRYDSFVGELAGAKDAWGESFFLIEGEQGYIYIPNGSNGIAEVKVVTKTSAEVFNEQPAPDRWYYEVRGLTKLVLTGDYEAVCAWLDVTADVVEIIETARIRSGIRFPGD